MPKRSTQGVADCHSSGIRIHSEPLTLADLHLKFDFRSVQEQQRGCPGIQLTAWHRQHVLASLILIQRPGATATLCCVQQPPLSPEHSSSDQRTSAIHRLLSAAKQFAENRHWVTLQYVTTADNGSEQEPDIRRLLSESAFRCATLIDQVRLATAAKSMETPPSSFQTLPLSEFRSAADVLCQPWSRPLLQLLQAVLSSSQDVTAIPLPSARDLLLSWASMRADVTILIANQPMDYAGLIVFSDQSMEDTERNRTLEYLGTHPNMRRRRVASDLIHAAVVAETRDHCSPLHSLTAFVDRDNTAARKLYAGHHFTSVSTGELWTCDVGAVSRTLHAPTSTHVNSQESERA